ncbi:MAG: prolipoprotein diacylglyceryl transferase, partial [Oscillospiraceae bacterium]
SIGGLQIYWYGILIALGFTLGVAYAFKRTKKFGVDGDRMLDILMVATFGGIIGARIYYVAFEWDAYKNNLSEIFNFRNGGIAIYGALIGGLITVLFMCKIKKVKLLPLLDVLVGTLFIGQAIGRWGNFVNVEAFGSNTTMPWGMTSPAIQSYLESTAQKLASYGVVIDSTLPVHPTFLYESIWCFIGFCMIAWFTSRRRFDGELLLIYISWYGLGRFFIEGMRTDSLMIGSFRVSQLLALILFIGSTIAWIIVKIKIKKANSPDFMKLYVHSLDGQSVVNGTFYPKKEKKLR